MKIYSNTIDDLILHCKKLLRPIKTFFCSLCWLPSSILREIHSQNCYFILGLLGKKKQKKAVAHGLILAEVIPPITNYGFKQKKTTFANEWFHTGKLAPQSFKGILTSSSITISFHVLYSFIESYWKQLAPKLKDLESCASV